MNFAIIVAAGSGSRFGGSIPKQFASVAGKAVLTHSLEAFAACSQIGRIVLVLSEEGIELLQNSPSIAGDIDVIVAAGGATRAESVRSGLTAIAGAAAPDDIVAIHDGARPLILPTEISEVIDHASRYGSACLVSEITDTIKEVDENRIIRTIDRTRLRRALTPQAFKYEIIRDAIVAAGDLSFTDECMAVERMGKAIACVAGDPRNIKITRPSDLAIAEHYLKERNENSSRARN